MSTRTTRRRLAASLAALALAIGAVTLATAPASAASRVGGIDMVQACKQQYFGFVNVTHGNTVVSWKCVYVTRGVYGQITGYRTGGLDLNRYCRTKWAGSWASYTNYYDPYSWSCVR